MIELNPVTYNEVPTFSDIVNSKYNPRKTRLLEEVASVESRTDLQRISFLAESQLSIVQVSDTVKEDLQHCFTVHTQPFLEIQNAIYSPKCNPTGQCGYCVVDTAKTIDHYLPKEEYPEFSVMSENLVPCCGHCNSKKKTSSLVFGSIFNPYYSSIRISQFIQCSLSLTDNILTPSYSFIESDDTRAHLGLLHSHDEKFSVLKKFKDKAGLLLPEELGSIEIYNVCMNTDTVVNLYRQREKISIKNEGANHWRPALYGSIASYLSLPGNFPLILSHN